MSAYIPEFLNEVTRIVVTTRNDNPSVEEYDRVVLPEWRRCEEIRTAIKSEQRTPTPQEQSNVARSVLRILKAKGVPNEEIRERFAEAFSRCEGGAYPIDRDALKADLWAHSNE